MPTTSHTEPLELRSLERAGVATETDTAELRFEAYNIRGTYAEMELKWGPSPRQQRAYTLGLDDLYDLHEWLTKVLGLEE